jgi:ATP-dependent Clp protease ATP-binding subunit ClpA
MINTTEAVKLVFDKAQRDAQKLGHEYITLEHVVYAILCVDEIKTELTSLEIDVDSCKEQIEKFLITDCSDITTDNKIKKIKKTRAVERMMQRSFTQALFANRDKIDIDDILLSILHEDNSNAVYFCNEAGITKDTIADNLLFNDEIVGKSVLQKYTDNLTAMASSNEIDPIVGRDYEVEAISLALGRKTKNNVLLVGDPGVGKTAIAEGLAHKIIAKDVPKFLHDYEVYSLNITSLLAGTRYRGEFEERMEQLLEELEHNNKIILYIDEAHMINGAGSGNSENPNDLANMLKPALSKGKIKVIASTTWEEYRKYFEKDAALMRRFQKVTVDEPDKETAIDILTGIKKYYENFHDIAISDDAIESAVNLSVKYQFDKKLPDKAIDLIDQACARFKLLSKKKKRNVKKQHIEYEIAKVLKMPLEQIQEKESSVLANLETKIKSKVFGQDDAVKQIVDKICIARAGLKDQNKPIGSFVLMGPTGTGKTETAKQLADNLGVSLIRFDMSEFQEAHSVSKLIGSPPGYVGYGEGSGKLINKLEETPNCVLLLDEIEKAHPDVSQLLLQIMDYGKITGSNGKEVNLSNCVLLLTTNLGAVDTEKNTIGFSDANSKKVYKKDAFKKFFSPEFRNRIDKVIVFNYLERATVKSIVHKFMAEVEESIENKKVNLIMDDSAIDYLTDKGYDREMGARPLTRFIEDKIKTPLSKELLFGCLKNGGTVRISASKDIVLEYETADA